MATLTATISGPTVGAVSKSLEAADADLLGWALDAYGVDDDGNPRSPIEAAQAALDALAKGIGSNVTRWKKQKAADQAAAAISDVALTEI